MSSYSDRRLKKDIQAFSSNATEIIKSIGIVEYQWKNETEVAAEYADNKKLIKASKGVESGKRVGVIAQQIKEVLPSCTWGDEMEVMGVNWMGIIPFIIKSIQEGGDSSSSRMDGIEKTINMFNTNLGGKLQVLESNILDFKAKTEALMGIKQELSDQGARITEFATNMTALGAEMRSTTINKLTDGIVTINDDKSGMDLGQEDMAVGIHGDLYLKDIGISNVSGPILQINPATGQLFYNNISDRRLKKNIERFNERIMKKLSQIEIYKFEYKSAKEIKKINVKAAKNIKQLPRKSVGAIAQDMKRLFPNCVDGDEKSIHTINWLNIIPYVIKGMQEMSNDIKQLSARIETIEELAK